MISGPPLMEQGGHGGSGSSSGGSSGSGGSSSNDSGGSGDAYPTITYLNQGGGSSSDDSGGQSGNDSGQTDNSNSSDSNSGGSDSFDTSEQTLSTTGVGTAQDSSDSQETQTVETIEDPEDPQASSPAGGAGEQQATERFAGLDDGALDGGTEEQVVDVASEASDYYTATNRGNDEQAAQEAEEMNNAIVEIQGGTQNALPEDMNVPGFGDLPGGTIDLPGVGEVPVAGVAVALLVLAFAYGG